MIISFHKICYDNNEIKSATNVMRSGWLTMGPKGRLLEDFFKKNGFPKINLHWLYQVALQPYI